MCAKKPRSATEANAQSSEQPEKTILYFLGRLNELLSCKRYSAVATAQGGSDFLAKYTQMQRFLAREDFEKTIEMFASFSRDILLIQEKADTQHLQNPDYAEELKETSGLWDVGTSMACLAGAESALAGLRRNLNLNLLAGVYFMNFGETQHV